MGYRAPSDTPFWSTAVHEPIYSPSGKPSFRALNNSHGLLHYLPFFFHTFPYVFWDTPSETEPFINETLHSADHWRTDCSRTDGGADGWIDYGVGGSLHPRCLTVGSPSPLLLPLFVIASTSAFLFFSGLMRAAWLLMVKRCNGGSPQCRRTVCFLIYIRLLQRNSVR